MLTNELLDGQKLAELAENEPLEVTKIWKTLDLLCVPWPSLKLEQHDEGQRDENPDAAQNPRLGFCSV